MTVYQAIAGSEIDAESPITDLLLQRFRDNPLAGLEGDPTAPVNTANWHPYNKLINNDANTGRIWSFAVDGAVAVITTPDFADGWDYGLLFDRVLRSGTAGSLQVNLFRETSGAYAGVSDTAVALSTTNPANGFFDIKNLRLARTSHFCEGTINVHALNDGPAVTTSPVGGGARHATAQKITRLQLSISGGVNFQGTGAAIYMLRRRNVAT